MSGVAIVRVQCGALDGGDDSHPEQQAGTAMQGDNGLQPHCHQHLGEPKCVIGKQQFELCLLKKDL